MSSMRMRGPYRVTLTPLVLFRHVAQGVTTLAEAKRIARREWDHRADGVKQVEIVGVDGGTLVANDTAGDGMRWREA